MHPKVRKTFGVVFDRINDNLVGDTVLDNCMGSGTTAIAAIREKRHYIGFELNEEYYNKSLARIKKELSQPKLF